jgi:hypothetical protein
LRRPSLPWRCAIEAAHDGFHDRGKDFCEDPIALQEMILNHVESIKSLIQALFKTSQPWFCGHVLYALEKSGLIHNKTRRATHG